jgi:putative membrane protein
MKIGASVAGLAGLGLAAWLLANFGLVRILDLVGQAGSSGIAAVIAIHLVQIAFSAAGWREIAGPMARRPTFGGYCLLRWIREGVNNLLPVVQIGGEFVATRLMRRRAVPLAAAIAGTVADLTIEMVTQIIFTLFGLGLLLHGGGGGGLFGTATGFVLVAVLVAAAFLGAQWFGVAVFERGLTRIGRTLGWAGTAQVEGLRQALLGCYRRPPRVLVAACWHGMSWLLGGAEVCLALHFLGRDTTIGSAMVIESLGQAVKAAVFVVPAAVGVQEGSYIVICHVFNISPEVAIALSLMKRLREVVLGVPGLVTWRLLSARGIRSDAQRGPKVWP